MSEPRTPTQDLPARVADAAAAIRARTATVPRVAITLGSGLSGAADALHGATEIPSAELPHWPRSTVPGHAGRVVLGEWSGVPVAVVAGRTHRYEGYALERATFAVRVLHALGAGTMIFTNAAGGIGAELRPGDLMLAADHLNFVGKRGLFTPAELADRRLGRRVAACYDPGLADALARAAGRAGVAVSRGVLLGMHGPSYETAAEIRWARSIGADAVCMSTVHEVTVAAHLGCRAASLSTITNLATGLGTGSLSHDDVTRAAGAASARLRSILDAFFSAGWPAG
jgi:purine-nucleoside phosphorylase